MSAILIDSGNADIEMVSRLLDAGADVNLQAGECGCPLAVSQESVAPLTSQTCHIQTLILMPTG